MVVPSIVRVNFSDAAAADHLSLIISSRVFIAYSRAWNLSTLIMLRLLNRVAKRERNSINNVANKYGSLSKFGGSISTSNFSTSGSNGGEKSPDIAVQLDYYMSLQFAGVACALVNGTSCV